MMRGGGKAGSNKFEELYALARKIDEIKPKRDRSTEDIEFERQKGECTF